MPIKKSAFKRLRQDKKKHEKNKSTISRVRTLKKKARELIAAKNSKEADAFLKKLESAMDRAVKRNIIKKNTASRNISRLRKDWAKLGK
jgi:small subunit ribosomal protein S20